MELLFSAKPETAKTFRCHGCPIKTQQRRRCREDRWDFTEADNKIGPNGFTEVVWPIQIQQGGALWSFCPGKATWDPEAIGIFRLMLISAETGTMLEKGGLLDQPDWFIDLLAWFIPRLEEIKFNLKCDKVFGAFKGSGGLGGMQRGA